MSNQTVDVKDWIDNQPITDFQRLILGLCFLILLLGAFSLESSLLVMGVMAAGFCMSGAQTGLNAFAPGYYPTESRATGVRSMLGIGRFGAIFGSLIGGSVLSLGLSLPHLLLLLGLPAFVAALAILTNGHAIRRAGHTALAH